MFNQFGYLIIRSKEETVAVRIGMRAFLAADVFPTVPDLGKLRLYSYADRNTKRRIFVQPC